MTLRLFNHFCFFHPFGGIRKSLQISKYFHTRSINLSFKLIGVREEDIPALAVAAFNDVCTGGNPRPTSVGDIEKLYRTAF